MSVTVTEIAQDQQGNYRFQGTATLGEGSRVVLGVDPDRDTARTIAEGKAGKEERYLAAVETHDPDDLPDMPREGVRVLRAPDGTLVDATEATVPALLAAGYTEAQGVAQRTDEAPPVRRRGRPRTQATRTLDSDDAARAAAEADLDPPVGDGDEM